MTISFIELTQQHRVLEAEFPGGVPRVLGSGRVTRSCFCRADDHDTQCAVVAVAGPSAWNAPRASLSAPSVHYELASGLS